MLVSDVLASDAVTAAPKMVCKESVEVAVEVTEDVRLPMSTVIEAVSIAALSADGVLEADTVPIEVEAVDELVANPSRAAAKNDSEELVAVVLDDVLEVEEAASDTIFMACWAEGSKTPREGSGWVWVSASSSVEPDEASIGAALVEVGLTAASEIIDASVVCADDLSAPEALADAVSDVVVVESVEEASAELDVVESSSSALSDSDVLLW